MERRDVLAVVTGVVDRDAPPPALPFELQTDLWLEVPDDELLERLKFACEPAEWPPRSPEDRVVDVTHCPYMFVRRHSDDDERLKWDPDQRINRAVAISRLVHSNSVWPRYAAKVLTDGEDVRIEPKIVRRRNYAEDPDARPWLSQDEAEALRDLLDRDRTIHIPEHGRLWHARWFLEYASQTHYVEVRLLHVIAGLEALMNTDSKQATKIFVKRLPVLSKWSVCQSPARRPTRPITTARSPRTGAGRPRDRVSQGTESGSARSRGGSPPRRGPLGLRG